ncbi:MAG TPA: glycosyltransferase [Acidimicrobiales bacterium]|jgi:teichuronic acid biosynthesis glycosyltransferase TuaH
MTKRHWAGLVVICGGTAFDGMVSPEREIATRLARTTPVLYVDPPLSIVRVRTVAGPIARLRILDDNLAHYAPLVQPAMNRRGLVRVTDQLVRLQLRHLARKLGGDVQAVVVANQRDFLGACGERVSVVYATDDFLAAADLFGARRDVLVQQVTRQARRADLAACVSDEVATAWHRLGVDTMVLRNGCDMEAGASVDTAPPPDVSLRPPVAGFLGNVSARIDMRLLRAIADRGISLLIVGPVRDEESRVEIEELTARPHVRWVGEQPSEAMPSYLAMIDVGLTPYADTAFNRGSFPLKTLEYLAAGRAVVSTGLPASRWLDTDLISIADGPADFADAVAAAASVPRTPELVAARRAFAAHHSWDARVAELAPRLGISGSRP